MRSVPDWAIQTSWWISGIFATGAVWYFLSVNNNALAAAAGVGAIAFALLAVHLHRTKDAASEEPHRSDAFSIDLGEEQITFSVLLRSVEFDVVKVHAHTHMFGVMAEHRWIHHSYPKSSVISQSLTTLERLKGDDDSENPVHFDVMKIKLANGREKKVYFDISDFFTGKGTLMDPDSRVADKLNQLYKSPSV
jgi:hypothetical protein